MPHSAQAKKRVRQSEKQRIYNKSIKTEIKTLTKNFLATVESKESAEAEAIFRSLVSKLDKAGRRNIFHRNTVARKKSRAARLLQSIGS